MGAGDVRGRARKVQDADAGDRPRNGLPRAVHAIARVFQRAAAAGSAVEAGGFSRRRPLGAEAAERATLVQDIPGLAGYVRYVTDRVGQRWRSIAAPLQR